MSGNPSQATIYKVKRGAFNTLKHFAFQAQGIIFGGMVRDEFIAEYYTDQFKTLCTDVGYEAHMDRFCDSKYMPATRARLLLPDDMDVSFTSTEDADRFINSLRNVKEFSNVRVSNIICPYGIPMIDYFKEVIVTMMVGAIPFITQGAAVTIKIDIVIPTNRALQPPFAKLDMFCNAFIMTPYTGKTLSRNTGTYLDNYSDFERTLVTAQILNDMKDFKTALAFPTKQTPRKVQNTMNLYAMKRILKMERKKFKWSFINMPFNVRLYDTAKDDVEYCCICAVEFNEGDEVAFTDCKKGDQFISSPCIHHRCFMKHLKFQTERLDRFGLDATKKFVFRCPHRNEIDFSKCQTNKVYKAYT